jgi:hypothetical protein
MNRFEQAILLGIASSIDNWKAATVEFHDHTLQDVRRWRQQMNRKTAAEHDGAVIDAAEFLGRTPTASETVMASRAYRRLEADGLIQRVESEWSTRTRAVLLLPAGQAKVQELRRPAKPRHGEGSLEVTDA